MKSISSLKGTITKRIGSLKPEENTCAQHIRTKKCVSKVFEELLYSITLRQIAQYKNGQERLELSLHNKKYRCVQ